MLTVALGASAGGLSALTNFFAHVPLDTPIAYLAMLDLSDEYQRQIEDALRATVSIPVTTVREWYRIEPNHIYLIPPRRGIAFIEDHVALSESATGEGRRAPVDALFHALARSRGPHASCIVLSGTGAGGSEGLRDVTEKGGFCLAQEPREAEYSEMPRSAIVTGMVEHVMSVADMPAQLVAHMRRFRPIPIAGTVGDATSTDRLDADRAQSARGVDGMPPETQRFNGAGRLELMMESDSDGAILTIDAELRIDSWNTGAARIFGWTKDQAIGELAERMLVTDDRHRVMLADVMRQAREEGRAIDERWHIGKDGSRVYLYGILTPMHDRGGAFAGFLEVACDLAEWKRREDALRSGCDELKQTVDASTQQLLEANQRLEREVGARREADRRIRSLITRIVTVQEDERRRIQRDLHDQVGQQVSALRLKLDALGSGADRGLHDWIEETRSIVSTLDHDLDSLTWQLGPGSLHELGLAVTLPAVVQEWSTRCGIPVTFRATGFADQRLDFDIETHLYRITQEALNNVLKHARATQVTVILELGNREVVLMVVDDGRGIDDASGGSRGQHGLGLIGMRERAALVGGTLQIGSAHGRGTTVVVRVPLPSSAVRPERVG